MTTEVSEFERIVGLGLGRAVVVLKTNDPHPYRSIILNACLNDLSFDAQIEGSRAQYVFDLATFSGDQSFFRAQILSALNTETDYYNLQQLFELARVFAQQGSHEARELMYARFAVNSVDTTLDRDTRSIGAEEIISLDGIKGLLFVLEKLGEWALADEDYWDDCYLLGFAQEKLGDEAVRREVERARLENSKVAAYLQLVEEVERDSKEAARYREDFSRLSYDELKQRTQESIEDLSYHGTLWGRHADEKSIEPAARDLLSEVDTDRIYAFLRIFWKRPFPFSPEPLIALSRHEDDKVARGALNALRNIRHPLVRELALSLLNNPAESHLGVDLLECNYEQGDHTLIVHALDMALNLPDNDIYHSVGFGALQVFETHPTTNCVPALFQLYENGPCSQCRARCFDLLDKFRALPEWMIEESMYDANLDLREKAAALT